MDTQRLKESFARMAQHGDAVPTFFYGYLFVTNPEVRDMFPTSLSAQRDRLVSALGNIVSNVDSPDHMLPFARSLGRDHRKFGVLTEHYAPVGAALLATLEYFLGEEWTPQLAADWTAAYGLVAQEMVAAADAAAASSPPWWDAQVVTHERRAGTNIAVITVAPTTRYDYQAGQSMSVECELRPRVWRFYSPANAPRADGSLELHVRSEPAGQLSPALVFGLRPGDMLRLGPPTGTALTLAAGEPDRDLLMLAGGTGLAPLRALIEQLANEPAAGGPRRVSFYHGARTAAELYDMATLRQLAQAHPWLTVTPVVSDDPWQGGEQGTAAEAALRAGRWTNHEVYLCGSAAMVAGSRERLSAAGIPAERIHAEEFDGHGYIPTVPPPAQPVAVGSEVGAR